MIHEGAMRRSRVVGLVACLLILHVIIAWSIRMPGVLTGEDEAIYLLLARQLGELRYNDVFLVHQPVHAMYPPGYPAALAAWGAVVGDGFDRLLVLGIIASVGALLLTFVAARRLWSDQVALLVLAPLAVNPYLAERAGTLASEAPYMLFTMLALVWGVRTDRKGLALAGGAALGAALTRSIGVTVFAALAVHWLWGRKFAVAALVGTAAALTVGGWLLWSFMSPGQLVGASYSADFTYGGTGFLGLLGVIAGRVVTNVPAYLSTTIPGLLPVPAASGTPVDNAVGAVTVTAGLAVGAVLLWQRWRVAALYLAAAGAVLAVWPWHIERFAMPLLPLLVTAVVMGSGAIAGRRWPRARVATMAGVALVLSITGISLSAAKVSAMAGCERGHSPPAPSCLKGDQASFFAALDYVRAELPADAILLTAKRATAYYYTGRRQIQWQTAAAAGPGRIIPFLREEGVGYVLLGSLHWADLDHLPNSLEPNCADLELVRSFPARTYLLRLRAPGEQDDGSGCRALADHRMKNVGRDFDRDP
jgi:hypothetical protein